MTTTVPYHKMNEYVPCKTSVSDFGGIMNSLFENFTYLEVYRLANIKSAKKRILVNETKAARNKAIKSKVKTSVKKVEAAVAQNDTAAAKTALQAAIREISKAGSKGVYHKNTVGRKISRLAKAVNSIA